VSQPPRSCRSGSMLPWRTQLLPPREPLPLQPTRLRPSPPFKHVSPPPRPRPSWRELLRPPSSSSSLASSELLHHFHLVLLLLKHQCQRRHQDRWPLQLVGSRLPPSATFTLRLSASRTSGPWCSSSSASRLQYRRWCDFVLLML
jgi:hypothetical protein